MLDRIEIYALADVAVADGLDVFLGILGSNGVFLLDRLGPGLLLGLLGAFAGALWAGVYIADLLSVSVLFVTTAFFFAAGLRLYEDLKASASPAAVTMVKGPLSPTGPLQSAAS